MGFYNCRCSPNLFPSNKSFCLRWLVVAIVMYKEQGRRLEVAHIKDVMTYFSSEYYAGT